MTVDQVRNFLLFTWFSYSLQDSFEYISQDPSLGKLSSNQNGLGTCRSGSNLGKYFHILCLSDTVIPSVHLGLVSFFSPVHHLFFFPLHCIFSTLLLFPRCVTAV